MTPDAWRSAAGGAWQAMLVYPGGLSALLLVALIWRWRSPAGQQLSSPVLALLACGGPLIALAALPVPFAGERRFTLDLLSAWMLLDAPLVLALALARREAPLAWQAQALSGGLTALPLLALLYLSGGQPPGALTLDGLAAAPDTAAWILRGLWVLSLPPLLLLGPWQAPLAGVWWWPLALRRLGHCALLAQALAGLIPPNALPRAWNALPVALALPGLGLLLAAGDRLGRSATPARWGLALWLGGGLLSLVPLLQAL